MEYEIHFNFTVAKKNSQFVGKAGVVEVSTDDTVEEIKESEELKTLIARAMNKTVKGALGIISVDITNVIPKND